MNGYGRIGVYRDIFCQKLMTESMEVRTMTRNDEGGGEGGRWKGGPPDTSGV